jgi:transcription antitermination factor NusG
MNLHLYGTCWFAIQVKPRHERSTALHLRVKGYQDFVPVVRSRPKQNNLNMETILYPGYVFCRFDPSVAAPIVTTPGVIRVVGNGSLPIPISDEEIARIRLITASDRVVHPWPFLKVGDRIRLREGPLAGVTGILLRVKNSNRLVVSIDLLCRSAAVELEHSWVESAEFAGCVQPGNTSNLRILGTGANAAMAA